MLRRVVISVVLTAAAANVAAGQTVDEQSARPQTDEQEIISLAREFADEALLDGSAVLKQGLPSSPERVVLAEDGKANPLKMDNVRVRIKGNEATLTSRLVFSGRRSNSEAYEHFDNWTVTLVKQENGWRVVQAQLGHRK